MHNDHLTAYPRSYDQCQSPSFGHSAIVDRCKRYYASDDNGAWSTAPKYVMQFVAEHARLANRLDEFVQDADYLVCAPPEYLGRIVTGATREAMATAALYSYYYSLHSRIRVSERRSLLAVHAARHGLRTLSASLTRRLCVQLSWATGSPLKASASRILSTDTHVTAVAIAHGLGGRLIGVSGDGDGLIRRWDLKAGAEIGHGTSARAASVTALVCARLDSGPLLALAGGSDGTVVPWDVETGEAIHRGVRLHDRGVRSISLARLDDATDVVVSCSWDGAITTSDPLTGELIHESLIREGAEVQCLTTAAAVRREPVAITGGWDGAVRLWRLAPDAELEPNAEMLMEVDGLLKSPDFDALYLPELSGYLQDAHEPVWIAEAEISAISGSRLPTDEFGVVVGDVLGSLHLLRFVGHSWLSTPLGQHEFGVSTIASASIGHDRSFVVSGGGEGILRTWTPGAGQPWSDDLVGHTGRVEAVDCTYEGDTAVVVSSGADRTLRVWELQETPIWDGNIAGHEYPIALLAKGLAEGVEIAITADTEARVTVWGLEDGSRLFELPPSAMIGQVKAMSSWADFDGTCRVALVDHVGIKIWTPRRKNRGTSADLKLLAPATGIEEIHVIQFMSRTLIVVAGRRRLQVLDLSSGTTVHSTGFGRDEDWGGLAQISRRGWSYITQTVGVESDAVIVVHDLLTGKPQRTLVPPEHYRVLNGSALRIGGRTFAIVDDGAGEVITADLARAEFNWPLRFGYEDEIVAHSAFVTPSRRPALALWDSSHVLRMWYIDDGTPIGADLVMRSGQAAQDSSWRNHVTPIIAVTSGGKVILSDTADLFVGSLRDCL